MPKSSADSMAGASTERCWAKIGLWGDASCKRLADVVHCRNCGVFKDAARARLSDSAPGGGPCPAGPKNAAEVKSMFLFRCAGGDFALEPSFVGEITPAAAVHKIPHRAADAIEGISNINGDLVLVVNMQKALGLGGAESARELMVLCKADGEKFAFAAGEIVGVRRFPADAVEELFSPDAPFVRGKIRLEGGAEAAVIDAELMSKAIIRRLV